MTTKKDNSVNCNNNSLNEDKGHQNNDKNTAVKKTPKMTLSKSDLIKLMGYLEAELEARDVVIATLKCEKVKSMLKNRGSDTVVKDPLAALQRDCFATLETNDDSLSYQQLGSLENLILQQRKTHLRIANILKHNQIVHRKVLDVELVKKQQLQYELKKLQTAYEKERLKHKQIVFFLLAERKKIFTKYIEERKRSEDFVQILNEEKMKMRSMAEGLEEESKKALRMEADLENELGKFEMETKKLTEALSSEEKKTKALESELAKYKSKVVSLEKELSESLQNNINDSSSNKTSSGRVMGSPSDPISSSVEKVVLPTSTVTSVRVSLPLTGIARSINAVQSLRASKLPSAQSNDSQNEEDSTPVETVKKQPIGFGRSQQSVDSGPSSVVKKSLFGIQRNMSAPSAAESSASGSAKKPQIARGAPPPVPPNKPNLPPKKDLLSFIKKPSVVENAVPSAEKEQKNPALRHNNFATNDIAASDKPEDLVKN